MENFKFKKRNKIILLIFVAMLIFNIIFFSVSLYIELDFRKWVWDIFIKSVLLNIAIGILVIEVYYRDLLENNKIEEKCGRGFIIFGLVLLQVVISFIYGLSSSEIDVIVVDECKYIVKEDFFRKYSIYEYKGDVFIGDYIETVNNISDFKGKKEYLMIKKFLDMNQSEYTICSVQDTLDEKFYGGSFIAKLVFEKDSENELLEKIKEIGVQEVNTDVEERVREIFGVNIHECKLYEKIDEGVLRKTELGISGDYTYELHYVYSLTEKEQIELYISYIETPFYNPKSRGNYTQ